MGQHDGLGGHHSGAVKEGRRNAETWPLNSSTYKYIAQM